ncbi:hypothetical protein TRIP_E280099 [uncultured Spirochaetota bacterium]|uniref:Uncharacterized protein n=1 Tax=uncultured Spirochaetota bacterium TaxID=460511 RepID=A0A652ZWF8_9SPIR|nr:hypothetical protein TRIP_E280099 [uncultured Spirochaetota bacterium]
MGEERAEGKHEQETNKKNPGTGNTAEQSMHDAMIDIYDLFVNLRGLSLACGLLFRFLRPPPFDL